MKRYRRSQVHVVLLAVLSAMACFMLGCAGPFFYHADDAEIVTPERLAPGMSRVIFMRPKNRGTTAPASILEVTGGRFRYAGDIGIKEKIAYDVAPGDHLFMVIGVEADFMSGTLEEGKTYYTEVVPQFDPGRFFVWWYFFPWVDWYGLFDLRAIHQAEIETGKPDEWLAACRWNIPDESATDWTKRNTTLMLRRFDEYRPKWSYRIEDGLPNLEPEDGFVGS